MITEFRGPYRFLSNFWPAEVEWAGFRFPTVEHAYQAAKFVRASETFHAILFSPTATAAKRLGQSPGARRDWDQVRVTVMANLVEQKFTCHTALRDQLLATHPEVLQEGNTWGDEFWGVDLRTGQGENRLGQLLMAVRERLRGGG
jgi:ribA/ribD-fused uncharacterized protein